MRAEIAGHEFVRRSKTTEGTMAQSPTAPQHDSRARIVRTILALQVAWRSDGGGTNPRRNEVDSVGNTESKTAVEQIVIRPNRSLSFRGMVWLFLAYLGLMAVIGLGFLGAGAWMVLPFAGVEAVLIFLIFYFVVYRHTNDHELVIIEGETVSVISQKGSSQSHHEFPRYWAKLKLERDEYSWYPSRLKLGCYGRLVEIGSGLGEQDRQVLAKKLKNLMASPTYG